MKIVYREDGYAFLEPSVAQPPLPLQEFLALQPLSPVLQPPLPAQEFLPAQECFSIFVDLLDLVDFWPPAPPVPPTPPTPPAGSAFIRATVPPNNPVKAAAITKELFETFIFSSPLLINCFQRADASGASAGFGKYTGNATGDTFESQERIVTLPIVKKLSFRNRS